LAARGSMVSMHCRFQCQVTGPGAASSSRGGRPPVTGQPAVRRCSGPARTGSNGQAAAREPRARGPRLGGGLLRAARAPEAAPAPPLRRRATVAAGRRLGRASLGGLLPAALLRLLDSPHQRAQVGPCRMLVGWQSLLGPSVPMNLSETGQSRVQQSRRCLKAPHTHPAVRSEQASGSVRADVLGGCKARHGRGG